MYAHSVINNKKSPNFKVRTLFVFYFHYLAIASSAISFHLPSVSIPAAASTDSPLSSTFVSNVSRQSIPRFTSFPFNFLTSAVFAFFRPLQFWILTTKPLFLPFLIFLPSASQWLVQCSLLTFITNVFPIDSCLISCAFLNGSSTRTYCMFPFILP